jgi:hypothetical protein
MALRTIIINFLGGTREKIVGAVLTENNFTDAEKLKLSSVGELTQEQLDAITEDVLGNIDLSGLQKKIIFSDTEPSNPEENDIWINTSN